MSNAPARRGVRRPCEGVEVLGSRQGIKVVEGLEPLNLDLAEIREAFGDSASHGIINKTYSVTGGSDAKTSFGSAGRRNWTAGKTALVSAMAFLSNDRVWSINRSWLLVGVFTITTPITA